MNYVTLFDNNYADRALVMYESMTRASRDFTLYVIAFDELCFRILSEREHGNMVIIPYDEFEDDVLKRIKTTRSHRELMWTCSGYSIRYVMKRYGLDCCTYIDADMCFYSDPGRLVDDFIKSGCDAAIIPHNFSDHAIYRRKEAESGKYCVEFNSFRNTEGGMKILNWWIDRCIESCSSKKGDVSFGDQKYLDEFMKLFDNIYEYRDYGAGVAPWNADSYEWADRDNGMILRRDKSICCRFIFYHFHSLEINGGLCNIHVFTRPGRHDKEFITDIYTEYLKEIKKIRKILNEKYGSYDTSKPAASSGSLLQKLTVLSDFIKEDPASVFSRILKIIRFRKYDLFNLSEL